MKRFAVVLVLAALVACTQSDQRFVNATKSVEGEVAESRGATSVPFAVTMAQRIKRLGSFANLPDRGELLTYSARDSSRQRGAYTWHRASVSEEHALRAIVERKLRLVTPTGEVLDIEYDHHFEHPSGDWTWVGHLPDHPEAQTILTFGAQAVFGSIGQIGKRSMRLTSHEGAAWLVETDPSKLEALASLGANPRKRDYLAVPANRNELGAAASAYLARAQAVEASAASAAAATTIDVVVGYSGGIASRTGGASAAVTRINNLVAITNEAFANSQVNARIRLVRTLQVAYGDATPNESALEQLTGYDVSSQQYTTPNAAFNSLRAAREQYRADLVVLLRQFRDPEQQGCGIAWLIGGGKSGITSGDDYFGYSVVSDGSDRNEQDGNDYFCRDESFAHELAHNIGSQHDREAARGDDGVLDDPDDYGAFSYSFGYKTGATAGNFFTIMAYGDEGQQDYRVFSNPRITTMCGGRACGTTAADNARSLGQLAPVVAAFRHNVSRPNLYAVNRQAGSRTQVNVVSASSNYTAFGLRVNTALANTGSRPAWVFRAGDYNRDGIVDMFVIKKMGATRTEVHVLDGATNFTTYLLHSGTPLGPTGSDESFLYDLGDYNGDGRLDLYVIKRNGTGGRTEVHVLDGRNSFKTFLLHVGTALPKTGGGSAWKFAVADYNRDGAQDLYVIKRNTSSGYAEVHILNGAASFRSYLLQRTMPFRAPVADNNWEFKVGNYNSDGIPDLYAIKKMGSGHTELHILTGADTYRTFLAHIPTALGVTGTDWTWDFSLAR